ncbi:MAG: hypothetical protein IT373_09910 [Polyangiaceae bacterium]|nr:hypothetical protein [Polyangiaceae bacterium]
MSEYTVYNLEVQASGLVVEVELGGARVYFEGRGGQRFTQKKLNPWLLDGQNVLEARLGAPEAQAGGRRAAAAERYFRTRLIRLRAGQDWPEPEDELFTYEWNPAKAPLPDEGMVTVLEHELALGPVHGRWAWQDARPYTDADRPDVLALVGAVHQALAARELEGVLARFAVQNDEVARALGGTKAELAGDLREFLASLFASEDWRMAPLAPETLGLVPSAGGKLVEVVGPDGGAPLVGRGGEGELELGLTVSRLAAGWTIVR